VTEDQADADTRADGREAVSDSAENVEALGRKAAAGSGDDVASEVEHLCRSFTFGSAEPFPPDGS
jgi:hypothetical protein